MNIEIWMIWIFSLCVYHLQDSVDKKLGGPFNVVVGESFSLGIDYIQQQFFYMYFGGYLAIYVWKCIWYSKNIHLENCLLLTPPRFMASIFW